MDEREIGRQLGLRVALLWLFGFVLVVSLYALPEFLAYFDLPAIDARLLRFLSKTIPDFAAPIIVISFAYEYWLRRHTIRYFQSLMFSEKVITDIISDNYLLEVMKFGLGRVLSDKIFASDIFDFVRHNAISQPEKRYNERNVIRLTNSRYEESDDVKIHYYDAEILVEYKKVLREAQMWFVCVRGDEKYNEIMLQQEIDWRWIVPPLRLFPVLNETFFNVKKCVIGGRECNVQKRKLNAEGDIGYYVEVPKSLQRKESVSVQYIIDVKVPRFGHTVQIGFPRPR